MEQAGGASVTPALITGYYHCDNCDRTVEHVQRTRGYWLCDECWAAIMPDWEKVEIVKGDGQKRDAAWYASTAAERARIEAYWNWYYDMKQRKPLPERRTRAALYRSYLVAPALTTDDDLYPLCECGQPRQPLGFMPRGVSPGLWGGPYRQYCPVCDAKRSVEAAHQHAAIRPEWDDEQWLDMLQKTMPEAFELGVLPDYWFRLRYPEMFR
jgi:hypothetical protein